MPELTTFATSLLEIVIAAVIPFAVGAVFRWAKAKATELEHITSAEQLDQFSLLVEMVVKAAEQSGLVGLISDKKLYAIDTLQAIVDARGWKIPVAQIEAEIEAAISQGLEAANAPIPEIAAGGTVNINVDNAPASPEDTPIMGTKVIDAELAQQ